MKSNNEKTAQEFLREYFRGTGYSNEIDYIRCMVAYADNVQSENNVNVQPELQPSIADKLREHIKEIGEEAFRKEWEEFDKTWTAEYGEQIVHEQYFEIISEGYNEELEREEIQIHAGENGNVFLIKTDEGFIVDVYNQQEHIDTMAIWNDDLMSEEEIADIVFDFAYPKVKAFIEKWGKTEEQVFLELGIDTDLDNQEQFTHTHFWEDTNKVWILKVNPEYTDEEQAISDYLHQPIT